MAGKLFTDKISYDIAKDLINTGEVFNTDAINQSIENILSTSFGERLFLPSFGSILPLQVFENITEENGEALLDSVIESISSWEDRITILKNDCSIEIDEDNHSIELVIYYVVNGTSYVSSFERNIVF